MHGLIGRVCRESWTSARHQISLLMWFSLVHEKLFLEHLGLESETLGFKGFFKGDCYGEGLPKIEFSVFVSFKWRAGTFV